MRAKNRLHRQIKQSRLPSGFISARLGNNVGDVEVSGRQNYVYARLASGDVIQVYNIRVVPVNDLDVYVGYDPKEPQLLQVLSIRGSRARYGDTASNNAYQVMPHHLTHEWMQENGGTDVVFTELRQFVPLRPQADGMSISIQRGLGFVNGTWAYISGSSKDLTTAIPSTGAYFGLVYVDVNGTLELATGVLKDLANLIPSDIPNPIPGTLPIAGVRLYGGQTGIAEARSITDLADLRFPGTSFNSIGSSVQQPNTVWAGPSTGTATDLPSFRSLVLEDIPSGVALTGVTNTFSTSQIIAGNLTLYKATSFIYIGDGTNSNTNINFDFPYVSSTQALFRIFRNTNTSGTRTVSIYKGDGTNTELIRFNPVGFSFLTNNLLVGTTTDGMTSGGSLAVAQDLAHRGSKLGVFNTTPTTKQTVTGSRAGNAALASLLTALAAYGLVTDSSSA